MFYQKEQMLNVLPVSGKFEASLTKKHDSSRRTLRLVYDMLWFIFCQPYFFSSFLIVDPAGVYANFDLAMP